MAKVEIEIGDDGKIGTLPEPLQKFVNDKFDEAFGKGKAKAATDAQAQITAAVEQARKEEREKAGKPSDQAAIEKAKNLEIELSKLKEEDAVRAKDFAEAQRLREERHANELKDREKALADLDAGRKAEVHKYAARLRETVDADIRFEAARAGTRDDSMDEVGELLTKFVDVDAETLKPVVNVAAFKVKFADSKLGDDGKPVAIEGLVAEYLSRKPHHKAPVKGTGGGARGGFSTTGTGTKAKDPEKEAALDALAADPSLAHATAAFGRIGKRAS